MMHQVFLHPAITVPSIVPYEKVESLSPARLVNKRMDNPTLLLLFLFGLATGEKQIDEATVREPIRDPLIQTKSSKSTATATQSQFINYPSEFQMMVNRVFQMEKVSTKARNFASAVRICACWTLTQSRLCDAVVESRRKKVELPYHCIPFIIADNIGFDDKADHDPTPYNVLR